MGLRVWWPPGNGVRSDFSSLGLSFLIWEIGMDNGTHLTGLLWELRKERPCAQHTQDVRDLLSTKPAGLLLPIGQPPPTRCHCKMEIPRVESQGPTPPLTSCPPLPECRACAGGADPGAGSQPRTRPPGPSPPPLYRCCFARGAAAAGSGAHGSAPCPHKDHLLPRVHPAPGGPAPRPRPMSVSAAASL